MKPKRSFASDNNAGVHPRVMEAVAGANDGGHVIAYGDDPYTARAEAAFREHFGEGAEVFFVFGGTGANVLGLQSLTAPHHAVVCAATAHVNVDECGAPEKFTGCKLIALQTADGKLRPAQIEPCLARAGDQHHVQPKVISISQPTELGTVYTVEETRALSAFARERGLLVHMDGARLANAAAYLGATLRELTAEAGVDVLSFGGTKNGMMYGEAVVFFDPQRARDFKFIRKQGTHLPSKMRFISAQFAALLAGGLWLSNAAHANHMARLLAAELARVPQLNLTQKVESNAVFARLPPEHIAAIQKEYFFYVWNEETSEVRLMASFDTTEEDIGELVRVIRQAVG
ncbi:MAG: low specificity L-threonine aldolase [Acidobacteria bacterium]|nr:low specificity L-threonine aldolase [Acidobacteriota bacterium]